MADAQREDNGQSDTVECTKQEDNGQSEKVEELDTQQDDDSQSKPDMVEEWNKLFAHRYTDQDEEYTKCLSTDLPDPPCVNNWYVRPKRTYDYSR